MKRKETDVWTAKEILFLNSHLHLSPHRFRSFPRFPRGFLFIITKYGNPETIGNFDARHIQPVMQALPSPATYNAHHERVLSAKFFWSGNPETIGNYDAPSSP
ncbi:hypothetical protein V6N13_119297 [Hibiscus sabdariffa]